MSIWRNIADGGACLREQKRVALEPSHEVVDTIGHTHENTYGVIKF